MEQLNELALFAGAGGGILGGHLLGWRTVCAVEWEQYPASVLCARQNDKILPPFPIWDDVQTFDGHPWRGIAQVVSGGFPCQDISSAGKGAGISGERSSMWKHMARIIGEVRPEYAFVENSPMLTVRGLGVVLGDLAEMGFDARWGVLGANSVGAPHRRDRIWIVAHTNSYGWASTKESKSLGTSISEKQEGQNNSFNIEGAGGLSTTKRIVAYSNSVRKLQSKGGKPNKRRRISNICEKISNTDSTQCQRNECTERSTEKRTNIGEHCWWETEPNVGRVADGVAARVDRLKAIGNGQVPLCAATAWELLK